MNLKTIKSSTRLFLPIVLSAVLFGAILIFHPAGILRSISLQLRTGFGVIAPSVFIIIYIALRLPEQIRTYAGMMGTMTLFALQLNGLWASGMSLSVAIVGLLPSADAAYYFHDSLRINLGWDISDFSAMRPLFAGFFSLLIKLSGHNLMISLAILTFLAGSAIYYAVREVQNVHGAEVAAFLFTILFLYFRHHSGTTMSENLGVPLGALSFALLWRGLATSSERIVLFGLFMLGLALNVRPGPMFVLPFAILWVSWYFRKSNQLLSWKLLFLGIAAVAFSFFINFAYIRLLAAPTGTAFSNFSWALYGLASGGKSFNHFSQAHPEIFALSDPERTRIIYRMSFELMVEYPGLLIQGLAQRWGAFFSNTWYSAFSFLGGENYWLNTIVRTIVYFLCLLGFVNWYLHPRDPHNGLVCLSALGIILSVPFVPPTDAYRVRLYAAVIVVFGLLPALGLKLLISWLPIKKKIESALQFQQPHAVTWVGALFSGLILAGPLLVLAFVSRPPDIRFVCPAGEDKVAIRFEKGSYINIWRDKKIFLDYMPDFHIGLYRRSIHNLGGGTFMEYFLSHNPETTIISSLDLLSNASVLVSVPANQLPPAPAYIGICGYWETSPELQTMFSGNQVIDLTP